MDLQNISKEELIDYIKLLEKALIDDDFKKYFIISIFSNYSKISFEQKIRLLKNHSEFHEKP